MEEWKECTLSDLGTIVGGATPSTKDSSNYENGSIAWITPKDLSTHTERFISHGERNITEKGLKSCSAQLMPPNSILFTSRAPIGYIAIAKNEVCTNQGFKSIVPNKDTDFMFLYYLLRYNKDNIENLGSGTTFKEVSGSTMRNVPVKVPPLPTQQKIAAILSSLDDKIELNNKINNNLEQQAQALFKNWFVDFEPFGGKMPEGWKVGVISDFGNVICGKTPSTKIKDYYGDEIPFITIPDMHNSVYACYTERYLSVKGSQSQESKSLPPNSICVSCIATPGLVILTDRISQTNQQINSIVPNENFSPYYIYLTLKKLSETIKMLGSSGSTTSNLNKEHFSKIQIMIPNDKVMKKFESFVQPMFEKIRSLQKENSKLVTIRDTLLPKLMNGEIKV